MTTVTGFAITKNDKLMSGIYMDEIHCQKHWQQLNTAYPDDKVHMTSVSIYFNDSDDTGSFGYKRIEGTWYLERYEGMGNHAYFQLDDNGALLFAEAVYKALGRLPGDVYRKFLKDHLLTIMAEADKAIEEVNAFEEESK